ncbi:DUF3899 domain-containing protein [Terrihalobacillus insolitus]
MFYFASFYFITSLMLFVIKGRFFDGVTFGFRRFRRNVSKNKDYLDQLEEKPLPSEKINANFITTFFFQGASLFVCMFALLIFYYVK